MDSARGRTLVIGRQLMLASPEEGVEPWALALETNQSEDKECTLLRFLKAIEQYPTASLQRDTALVELVVDDGPEKRGVLGAIVESAGERIAAGSVRARPRIPTATTPLVWYA